MFNKGDLVRVRSHSIIQYSVRNGVSPKQASAGNRHVIYQAEPESSLHIEYYPEPRPLKDKPVGEVLEHIRKAFYLVKLPDKTTVICFPDELELVYTT